MSIYRQGDVLVRRIAKKRPTGTAVMDEGRVILAYGEVTGHAHEVVAQEVVTDLAMGRRFGCK